MLSAELHKDVVSVVIPCRNEARFIGNCIESLLLSDYPREKLEILIVDGMSDDGTRGIILSYVGSQAHIVMLDNPKRITPSALNVGIRMAKGDIVIRMDAHAVYPPDYIGKCVRYLHEFGVDNVGGVINILPQTDGFVGQVVAWCLKNRFGVGNSDFRCKTKEIKLVDTVFGGCYPKEVFERVGLFNEKLRRSQDIEFNRRLRNAEGKILLVPSIVCDYYTRSGLLEFCRSNYVNGLWAMLPLARSNVFPLSIRHVIPLLFVLGLVVSALLGSVVTPLRGVLYLILIMYGALCFVASSAVAVREKDIRFFAAMPPAFFALHICYGIGSLVGLGMLVANRAFWSRVPNFFRRVQHPCAEKL